MSYRTFSTRLASDAYEAICRKAIGLPRKGRHVGGGRHVTIPPSPPGPGWTTAWSRVRKHPARKEYAVVALDPAGAIAELLTDTERAKLEDEYAKRTDLDETWEREA